MRKWQKTWLTLLTSSFAVGWLAQSEAAIIKVERVRINQAQPIQVFIIDSNGKNFERTVNYNPSIGGIEINTGGLGPNTSIFIPALGIGYIWHNGYWVDQEGYYWDGTQRVAVPHLSQWRERWSHYWDNHRIEGFQDDASWQRGGEGRWQDREGSWDRGDRWQGREDSWNRGDDWRADQTGNSGAYQGGQAGTMRSAGSFQGGQSDSMSPSGQGGAMRSAGGPQGGDASSGSMSGGSRSTK